MTRGDLSVFRGPVPKPASGKGGIGLRKHGPSRVVASVKEWERIREQKLGPCRACHALSGDTWKKVELHHVVMRSHGGDDVADNLVPLHPACHEKIHAREQGAVRLMLSSLSDAEYSYAVGKGGEGFFERAYGLIYERAA